LSDLCVCYRKDADAARAFMLALRSYLDEGWSLILITGTNGGWVWLHQRTDAEMLHHLFIEETLLPRHHATRAKGPDDAGQ
jgi:hypothetical protein